MVRDETRNGISGEHNRHFVMTGNHYIPTEKIADFVDSILVLENNHVKTTFSLPLFANGKPTLLFQTTKGTIKNNSNYLTLFGQTILPEQITFTENFTLIAFFFKPFALTSLFGFSAQELTAYFSETDPFVSDQTDHLTGCRAW